MVQQFGVLFSSETDASRNQRLEKLGCDIQSFGTLTTYSIGGAKVVRHGDFYAFGIAQFDDLPSRSDQSSNDLTFAVNQYAAGCTTSAAKLSGRFSFGIHNANTSETVLFRDRYGVFPLYRAEGSQGIAFSSDMRLAAHLSNCPIEANSTAIAAFIAGEDDDPARSCFNQISRVPAGHTVKIIATNDSEACEWREETKRYFQAELPPLLPKSKINTRLRSALITAVERQHADPQFQGYMLSGGLDSSSLVMLAKHAHPKDQLTTLSFVYKDQDSFDESEFINTINQTAGSAPVHIQINEAPDLLTLPDLVQEQFELCPAPGLLKSREIYKVAQDRGLTSLVDGHGGDEVISHGYVRLAELASQGKYFALWRELLGAARVYGHPVLVGFLGYVYNYAPLPKRSLRRRLVRRLGRLLAGKSERTSIKATDLLTADMQSILETTDRQEHASDAPNERRDHLDALTRPLSARAFEVLRNTAAAHGIEPKYPFYDQALIDVCLAVPTECKLKGGWSRRTLRDAMKGLMPDRVRWRKDKADFTGEVAASIRNFLSDSQNSDRIKKQFGTQIDARTFDRFVELAKTNDSSVANVHQFLWRCIYLSFWKEAVEQWQSQQVKGELL